MVNETFIKQRYITRYLLNSTTMENGRKVYGLC